MDTAPALAGRYRDALRRAGDQHGHPGQDTLWVYWRCLLTFRIAICGLRILMFLSVVSFTSKFAIRNPKCLICLQECFPHDRSQTGISLCFSGCRYLGNRFIGIQIIIALHESFTAALHRLDMFNRFPGRPCSYSKKVVAYGYPELQRSLSLDFVWLPESVFVLSRIIQGIWSAACTGSAGTESNLGDRSPPPLDRHPQTKNQIGQLCRPHDQFPGSHCYTESRFNICNAISWSAGCPARAGKRVDLDRILAVQCQRKFDLYQDSMVGWEMPLKTLIRVVSSGCVNLIYFHIPISVKVVWHKWTLGLPSAILS